MPTPAGPACKLVRAHFGDPRLSAVMPSQVFAIGTHIAVENTFMVDFGLPHDFYQHHVKRICQIEQLLGNTPCVLWLCAGYDHYLELIDNAQAADWTAKLALPTEFDAWLMMYMRCIFHLIQE